jgi:uncharacterized protein
MPVTMERRILSAPQIRAVEFSSDAKSIGRLSGYASVFNSRTRIGNDFLERVAPGCFDRALRERDDVRCLVNHDASALIGRVSAGTLRLSTDARGLVDEVDVPPTQVGKDLMTSVRRSDIDGQSFGFVVDDDDWDETDDPEDRGRRIPLRTLRSVKLLDVSFVTYPQYEGTTASASRSQTFETYFPDGVPKEIRSRFGATEFRARFEARLQAPSRESLEHRIEAIRLW